MTGRHALAVLALLAVLVYPAFLRARFARWGATEEEFRKPLPGDELFQGARLVSTRAITIEAPPAEVWPWIVQIGHGRAGFYSHDWVERLLGIRYAEGRSATRILTEFQDQQVGSLIPYHPLASFPVIAFDPPHLFIAGEWFVLEERDGGRQTRLLVRTRGSWFELMARTHHLPRPAQLAGGVIDRVFGEPLHHYMETGMLRGIKARVESSRGHGSATITGASAAGIAPGGAG